MLVSLILVANLQPVSRTPAVQVAKFTTCVVDTGGKFAGSVIYTCGKFATGVLDIGGAP